jgi:hypothetical protein
MARNESIIAIPPDLEDVVVLRRVLGKIVEGLDIVTGARANAEGQYLTKVEFDETLTTLQKAITSLQSKATEEKQSITLDQQALNDALVNISQNTDAINQTNQAVADLEDRVDDLELNPATDRMRWLGTWSSGSYDKNDVVKHTGAAWVAGVNTIGTPGVSSDWESLI